MNSEMDELIDSIKDKAELRELSDDFVAKRLAEYGAAHPDVVEKYERAKDFDEFKRSQEYEDMQKEVRSLLREVYGAFIMEKYDDMEEALEELREDQSLANHCNILSMHRSSKERLPFYEKIYEEIFDITGGPNSILDLACGLNPFSYPFLGYEPDYYASDISPWMCGYIQDYFEMRQIEGESFVLDLLEVPETGFPSDIEADVCFLFKTLDSLESLEWDVSEKILKKIPAEWLVVSFARQSLGGQKIDDDRRSWFEDIVEEEGWSFEKFEVPNESFYVVHKT